MDTLEFPPSSIPPLSGPVSTLYAIYHEIAARDHRCRLQALYGNESPPAGHTPFRPLPLAHFAARFEKAKLLPDGERQFRCQLARWAECHGIDCLAFVVSRRAA